MNKTALIIGATGLVGEECLKELLASSIYEKVIVLARKQPQMENPKLKTIVVDFDKLEAYKPEIKADDIYCTIGTTIAKAGSQAAFKKVDYEIPLRVAEIAKQNGAKKFILVSAMGANSGSGIFYSRVKGELEDALKKLNYDSLIIFRPSLLIGNRKEKRTGEAIGVFVAKKLSFLFTGPLKKYRGTPVEVLAKKMVQFGIEENSGMRIVDNEQIVS